MRRASWVIGVVALVAAAGTLYYVRQTADDDLTPSPMTAGLSFERLTNTYFTAEPRNPFDRPRVDIIRFRSSGWLYPEMAISAHGRSPQPLVDAAGHFPPVQQRQADVKKNNVGRVVQRRLHGLNAVGHNTDGMTGRPQQVGHRLGAVRVVFRKEDA